MTPYHRVCVRFPIEGPRAEGRRQDLVDFSLIHAAEPKSWNIMQVFHHMRLRKAPFTEFRRVSTSLDDYSSVDSPPVFLINNIPMDVELKENDLISFLSPMSPQCRSRNVVKNGTCLRTMENGTVFRVQRYICRDCRYSFVARPPN